MNRENSYICIKKELSLLCKEICSAKRSFYNDDIYTIERHGAKVKVKCFPARKNKRAGNREETLVICAIYTAIRSETASWKADAYNIIIPRSVKRRRKARMFIRCA